jgi:hypothetical protein
VNGHVGERRRGERAHFPSLLLPIERRRPGFRRPREIWVATACLLREPVGTGLADSARAVNAESVRCTDAAKRCCTRRTEVIGIDGVSHPRSIYRYGRVAALSLDYQALLARLDRPLDTVVVGGSVFMALGDRYAVAPAVGATRISSSRMPRTCSIGGSRSPAPGGGTNSRCLGADPRSRCQATAPTACLPAAPRADKAPVDRSPVIRHLSGPTSSVSTER